MTFNRGLLVKILFFTFSTFLLFITLDLIFPFDEPINYSTVVKNNNGEIIDCFLSTDEQWRFLFEESDFNEHLVNAILHKEDKYFFYHYGINPFAIARALINNLSKQKKTSGASTISMQVCRMLKPKERSYKSKLIEMFNAVQLEWHYSKKEILQLYFSLLPYGGNVQGVKTASILFLNKEPKDLSPAQITCLSIIPNRPNSLGFGRNDSLLLDARNKWLKRYCSDGLIDSITLKNALSEPLEEYTKSPPKLIPHFGRRIKNKFNKAVINTYLDPEIQDDIQRITSLHVNDVKNLNINNASVIIIDNKNQTVVGYLGSSNFSDKENAGQVDGVKAIRSPGSTLKPFLYTIAFDKGLITPKATINDIPINLAGYRPNNFDENFNGRISISESLSRSLNVPSVRLLSKIGVDPFITKMGNYGFEQIYKDREKLGHSVILGGCGVRLEELAHAYSSIANYGIHKPLNWHKEQRQTNDSIRIFSKGACYLTTDILTQITRPDLPNKLENNINIPKIAWKTGTSYGRRDAWSIGYNAKYTVGVWIGNFTGEGARDLSGAQTATPLLFKIFNAIQYQTKEMWFAAPNDLDFRYICSESGKTPQEDCKNQVLDFYFPKKSPNEKCEHYKKVFVSPNEKTAYCTRCVPESGYKIKKYLNIEKELISFYELFNLSYDAEPIHNSECERIFNDEGPEIIFPEKETEYILYKSSNQKIFLKASVSKDVKYVYWFVNSKFLGKYEKDAVPEFIPKEAGHYIFSCSDDKGRNSSVKTSVRFI